MASTTNLYRAITAQNFPQAKQEFLSLMREKLNAVITTEYKETAADFVKSSQK